MRECDDGEGPWYYTDLRWREPEIEFGRYTIEAKN
jgi:hypothetical protein